MKVPKWNIYDMGSDYKLQFRERGVLSSSGTELEFQIKIEQIQILSMKYEICNMLVEIELMMH